MKIRIALIAAALVSTAAFAPQARAQDSSVTFQFETGRTGGTVMVALFSSGEGYNRDQSVASRVVPVTAETVSVTFEGLAPGSYAMRSFYDINDDGEMNTNLFGMPVEPYAFSNNARGNMGPASWERARFNVNGAVVQTISLR
ncbi:MULTISPECIES: DUF2141 domain-containing protein [unclassified Brevundimonas]|uniref:DUF2141 domain-containing protein n=1 Tax=unclassified Brevundimonas TaxID=2622653 RepID=UPI000C424AED|nr:MULTISPECIES: DUF2141 domain-containing protein [unclassified Brevundimonas]MAL87676.1 hypothetical protein [Brevundimonas sp.]HAJ01699.1 hypothetical protein [Brevundimonas sp.]HAV51405.1 hypothetical protein [Brevundimonas sp.]|tara:strand:- start:226 stop:654 length:429 start_codon:yes stop_codon:yes gene_type:complete